MALQFRRGLTANLPDPSDAAIGEPLFTVDEGKLRIKKADGSFVVIGSAASSGNLDLSGIAAGSMVKVNNSQDGFMVANAGDLPLHKQRHAINGPDELAPSDIGAAAAVHTHTAEAIASGTLPSAVQFETANGTGFSIAVGSRLLLELPTTGEGALDIAQESTLVGIGEDIDDIVDRVEALELRPDGVDLSGFTDGALLKVDASSGSGDETLAEAVAGTDYIAPGDITKLRAVFDEASLPANAGTTTGYLKWTYSSGSGQWSVVATAIEAPPFIDGGNAFADEPLA